MKTLEVDMIFLKDGKEIDFDNDEDDAEIAFKTKDGTIITEFDGCDWKENPAKIIVALSKKVKEGQEIAELIDGSDNLWYGIVKS